MSKKSNALIHASSPYLLQHAYNPVEWNEWNVALLEKAKKENKLLIISIGYAACHWCHVMEHESFEKEEVAEWMNGFYINIKVDREERPDIDAVYMNAAQLTTGRGGWPLNVVALPDGRPVFAGTYFPMDHWIRILEHFAGAWKKNPGELVEVAGKIEEGLNMMENEHFLKNEDPASHLESDLPEKIAENIFSQLDLEKGGLNKAPKFPMPCIFDFLLNYNYLKKDDKIKNAIHATLINMLQGGIYDQVGGGFARYSVDEYWFAPHFEKMMYDNGQLISLYSKAYALTGVKEYEKIADEIIVWIVREMTSPEHLFYSSLDADSEGVEGKFYCFTKKEIFEFVTWHPEIFSDYFSIEEEGNWEHSNILFVGKTITELSKKYQLEETMIKSIIETGKEALLDARKTRVRPGLDDKVLTSWNALTITGILKTFQISDNYYGFAFAKSCLNFLLENMKQPNGLFFRNYKNNKASIPGFLDDQVFMMEALVEMYRSTWTENYLLEAKKLMELVLEHYLDKNSGGFFYAGKEQHQPVVRTKEVTDNVIPSANSAMANMLFVLGEYFYREDWIRLSKDLCLQIKNKAVKHGPYFSNWANTILLHTRGAIEVAITGPLDHEKIKEFYKIPGLILMHTAKGPSELPLLKDKPVKSIMEIYICRDKTCGLPVNTIEEAVTEIRKLQPG
jgi:uncharacterized protein YyaL (SSP411 family)